MPSHYDYWERLVVAVLDREELRRLALLSSRETSFSSSISSSFNVSANNSRFITDPDYVQGSLTDQMIKAAEKTVIFKQECLEIKSKAEKLAGMLQQAAASGKWLVRPAHARVISDAELILDKALKLVMRCSRQGMKRVFNVIPPREFRKISSLLEKSIENVSWLISISNSEADAELKLPPITINEPILSMVWEQITTLYMGSIDDQPDAAVCLASLARGSARHGKLIVEEGGIGPSLKLVEEGNLEGQENAIRAIRWLVKYSENAKHMIDAGAPEVFVRVLKQGAMKVQVDVAWAVSELALHYPDCQNLFAQHEVVAVLAGHLAFETVYEVATSNKAWAMEYPITKARLKEMAARALWHLPRATYQGQLCYLHKHYNSAICISITESCAIPCFIVLSEERVLSHSLPYYSSMVLSEIIRMAEKNPQLRRSAFDPNSPNYKALVSQLHRVLEMGDDLELLISSIKIVGHFATTFEETDTSMMISPLLKLMSRNESKFSTEACIVLTKLCSVKEIIDAGGAYIIVNQLYCGEDIVRPYALLLLCCIARNMPDSKQVAEAGVLDALKWASGQPSLSQDAATNCYHRP